MVCLAIWVRGETVGARSRAGRRKSEWSGAKIRMHMAWGFASPFAVR
jgi:hypothetical protein